MKFKHVELRSFQKQIIFAVFIFLIAMITQSHGDDKKKISIPKKPAINPKINFKPAGSSARAGKPSGTPSVSKPGPTAGHPPPAPMKKDSGSEIHKKPGETDKPKVDSATKAPMPKNPGGHTSGPLMHAGREGNNVVTRTSRGDVRVIERPGLRVQRNLRGERTFVKEGPNGRRIVATGRHSGYMQRTYVRPNGRLYVQRTYIVGGHPHAVAYRAFNYRGAVYYRYAPAYYYRPAFYGWAYSPWAVPVAYEWGWAGSPWYAGYGYYFTPYAAYTSASLWLTDYLLAESLQVAYAAAAESSTAGQETTAGDGAARVALSPEIKQMIVNEVKLELAEEKGTAGQGTNMGAGQVEETPPALDPAQKIFIVADSLDLVDDSGRECAVTAGDVLLRMGKEPDTDNKIGISVQSSKQGDCPVDTNAEVAVSDLQEMHNQFREKMDAGLKTLAAKQGKNGLPAAPDTGTLSGEVAAPVSDPSVESDLQEQQKNADEVEREVARSSTVASQNK